MTFSEGPAGELAEELSRRKMVFDISEELREPVCKKIFWSSGHPAVTATLMFSMAAVDTLQDVRQALHQHQEKEQPPSVKAPRPHPSHTVAGDYAIKPHVERIISHTRIWLNHALIQNVYHSTWKAEANRHVCMFQDSNELPVSSALFRIFIFIHGKMFRISI